MIQNKEVMIQGIKLIGKRIHAPNTWNKTINPMKQWMGLPELDEDELNGKEILKAKSMSL